MSEDRARRTWATVLRAAVVVAGALPLTGGAPPPKPAGPIVSVVLREGRGTISGALVGVDPGGVSLRLTRADGVADDVSTLRVVGWDRLLRIDGAAGEPPIVGLSDAVWRARTRIERGDTRSAEGLLTELAAKLEGQRGPTAAAVFEGLLRCRAARAARAGAVSAWLSWVVVMERSGGVRPDGAGIAAPTEWLGGAIYGAPMIDMRTGLPPPLPPMWVNEPALVAAASAGEWRRAALADDAVTAASELARWYQVAARFEERGDTDVSEWPREVGTIEGTRIVRWIVQSRVGDASRRAAARAQLQGLIGLETTEPWLEAWCRAAIGRSLIRESDTTERIRGVIEMLHVPARLQSAVPALAATCLAEAAVVLHEFGDESAAARLKQELLEQHADHPAAAWSRLGEIPAAPAAPADGGQAVGAANVRNAGLGAGGPL